MKKLWLERAWKDYLDWQENDVNTLKRINELIRDAERDPFHGKGKPEPLKGEDSGSWSRRINKKDRLVYKVSGDIIEIVRCKEHYGK